jgi:hypothetical protein
MDVIADGELSFYKKVSSEANYDYLRFYIDDDLQGEWEGEEDWCQETFAVTAGNHAFKWAYEKDYSVSGGADCAWLDYIVFPGTSGSGAVLSVNATAMPEEICLGEGTQLQANVAGGTGSYTYLWTPADNLNDPTIANPIATPAETTLYNVEVDDGDETVNSQVLVTVNELPETPVIEEVDDHLVSNSASGNQWYGSNGPINGATGQQFYPTSTDHYYVEVTNSNGCVSESSNVIYFVYTGVAVHDADLFNIYPNPANDQVHIQFKNEPGKTTIYLKNMLNEVVYEYSGTIRSHEVVNISLYDLSKGILFFQNIHVSCSQARYIRSKQCR